MPKFYITTAIDYVNGPPHIGHAYEKIACDVLARHFRQRGYEVFFLTGSDEHGSKIEKTASSKDLTPKEFTDIISSQFKNNWEKLDISYDRYIRTTDEDHVKVVQHIFKTLLDKGDIYKASYTGLYCTGCESFISPRDLTVKGLCPNHNNKPLEIQEENYFFKLTKYKEILKKHILENENFILPQYRRNELLNQLDEAEDISVSRTKNSVSWGIPVPEDEDQTIYVWIDALSNYITGVGYLSNDEKFKKYWPADIHMIGKDILKFHAIYWPSILLAMDIPLPKTIFAHGWITVENTKMSKTLGNVINPVDIMDHYKLPNADAIRYFLMTTTTFGSDGNYSDDEFKAKVNADLANNLGNLLNRTLSMLIKYFDGDIIGDYLTNNNDTYLKNECIATLDKLKQCFISEDNEYGSKLVQYDITNAASHIFELVNKANKYINDEAPWAIMKTPDENNRIKCLQILYNVLETLRQVSVMIYPYTPNISQDIWQQLNLDGSAEDQKLDDLRWGDLKSSKIASIESIKPVFLRIDSEIAGAEKKK